jgi:hypothetical protein
VGSPARRAALDLATNGGAFVLDRAAARLRAGTAALGQLADRARARLAGRGARHGARVARRRCAARAALRGRCLDRRRLKVVDGTNVVDGTLAGMLADRADVEARLLRLLEATP